MSLRLEGLSAGYVPGIRVVDDVHLEVADGSLVAVLGANGAGKSTLLKVVAGLVPAMAGAAYLDGAKLPRAPHRVVRSGVGLVPERRQVFPLLTVAENLELGAVRLKGDRNGAIEAMYAEFPQLAERRQQLAGTLSGGEQAMLSVARALVSRPRVLMMDEPSQGLAPVIVRQLFDLIAQIRARGTTVLLVEQNARMAMKVADRGFVMRRGRIVADGDASSLLAEGRLASAYFGEETTD